MASRHVAPMLLATAVLCGSIHSSAAAGQAPTLTHRAGTPLVDVIGTRWSRVVVEKGATPPLSVIGPPGRQLEWMSSLTDIVVVARVEDRASRLTQREDWIASDVTARVQSVLKAPINRPVARDELLRFSEDGGEMKVGGVQVQAVLPWCDPFAPGERYLLFLTYVPSDGTLLIGQQVSYRIDENDRLVSLSRAVPSGRTARTETGVSLTEAVRRIRSGS